MDLQALRAQFPHTETSIYVNHAATSPLSRPVMDAVEAYLAERHRTKVENFFDVLPELDATRSAVAALLGTSTDRVDFQPNTSTALGLLAGGLDWQPGDRVAIPACEFPANVFPFLHLRDRGVEVDFIPHEEGTFTVADVERALTPRTRLLTVSWVQFLSGFRADLPALGALCRERDVLFCVDAIQGLGPFEADVAAWGIDFLASGTHKWLMGTQGLAVFYVSEALQAQLRPPAGWLHGPVDWEQLDAYDLTFHDDAQAFRTGTMNHVGILALQAALRLRERAGGAWCREQVLARRHQLADGLARLGLARLGLARYGSDDPAHASGIVTVRHPEPEALYDALGEQGIKASVRNRLVRFAPTYYNSPDEIDAVLEAVAAFGRTQVATS